MKEFALPSFARKSQKVWVDEENVYLGTMPKGHYDAVWAIEELLDATLIPPEWVIAEKRQKYPEGEIRLPRTWAEQRLGTMEHPTKPWPTRVGIRFKASHGAAASQLLDYIRSHPKFGPKPAPYTAFVDSPKFFIGLLESSLVATYRYHVREGRLGAAAARKFRDHGESEIPLEQILGFDLTLAPDDKYHFVNSYAGTLRIQTSLPGRQFGPDDFYFNFPKSFNMAVSNFVETCKVHIKNRETSDKSLREVDLSDQLTKLGRLRTEGLLSDEEFAVAKNKLLGS